MRYDIPKEPQLVGGFSGDANLGFNQNLEKLTKFFESKQLDIYTNFDKILSYRNLLSEYTNILFEDCYKSDDDKRDVADRLMLEQLIENSREQIRLTESGPMVIGGLNPIVGLTLPLLKRVWLRTIRRDIIPTVVAKSPVIKGAKETLFMEGPIDPVTKKPEIYVLPDSFYDGTFNKLMRQIKIPLPRKVVALPETEYSLLPTDTLGAAKGLDSISTDFYIDTAIVLRPGKSAPADISGIEETTDDVLYVQNLRVKVNPETKTFNTPLTFTDPDTGAQISDYLAGEVNFEIGTITAASFGNKILGIKVAGYVSNENNLYTASTKWKRDYYTVEIDDGIQLNTMLTMQRVQDSQVLFDIDETAKAVHTMGMAIEEIKDRDVLNFLNKSKERIAGTKFLLQARFNCKRPTNYTGLTSEYIRSELKVTVNRFIQKMKEILNIEEVAFVIAGHPLDIELLDDVVWTIQPDTVAGGVKLNYSFGVMNRMHNVRVISSTRLDAGILKFFIHPLETGGEFEQLVYKSYEYSFNVVGNSAYRNVNNPLLPNVMVCTRYKNEEFIPAQGEIILENNDISTSGIGIQGIDDPVGP